MNVIEQQLIEKISYLAPDQQSRVLAFVDQLPPAIHHHNAIELMKLPADVRDQLVRAAFERSADQDIEYFDTYTEADFGDAKQRYLS